MTITPYDRQATQSLTVRSALALAIAAAVQRLGVALPEGFAQELASALIDAVMMLGLIGVSIGRARARGPLA